MNRTKHSGDAGRLKSLFFSLHNRRAVSKIVGNKTFDVTAVSSRSRRNLKLFCFQVHSELKSELNHGVWVAINRTKNSNLSESAIAINQ